jgi:hypothetical protein
MNAVIPEEPEHVPMRPIAWTFGAAILAIVSSILVVWALRAFDLFGGGRTDIEHLHLVLPSAPFDTQIPRAAEPDLDQWRWADASHQHVIMPIDPAIDRYLEERHSR